MERRESSPAARSALIFSGFGALALLSVLVFSALVPNPGAANLGALLVLGLLGLIAWTPLIWTPLARRAEEDGDVTTWILFVVMATVYSLARRAGPEEGWPIPLGKLLPDSTIVLPYTARAVLLGALLSAPAWARNMGGALKSALAALGLVAGLGLVSFFFLRGYYPATEVPVNDKPYLDPRPLAESLVQCVEYAALALCCAGVSANLAMRRLALRALPLLLLVWARHVFKPVPIPEDE